MEGVIEVGRNVEGIEIEGKKVKVPKNALKLMTSMGFHGIIYWCIYRVSVNECD